MLSHHIDPLDSKLTRVACLTASSVSSKTFIAFSSSDEFQRLPFSIRNAALRLARILGDEKRLTSDRPQWSVQFDEFMRDSSDESPFFMRSIPPKNSKMSATACLAIMAEELRFNICEFSSSFVPNEKAAKLETLALANISPQLRFACLHWTEQVSKITDLTHELLERLSRFFKTNFLHWLEVASYLRLHPSEMLQDLNQKRVRDPYDIILTYPTADLFALDPSFISRAG